MSNLFLTLNDYIGSTWPDVMPQWQNTDVLNHVWIESLHITPSSDKLKLVTNLLFEQELVLNVPGLDALALVLAAGGNDTVIPIVVDILPQFRIRIKAVPAALRLNSSLFQPVRRIPATDPNESDIFEPDPGVQHVEIALGEVTLTLDGNGNIELDLASSIDLPPCMIERSGVVLEASNIELYLRNDAPPPGKPAAWRGIYIAHAALYLPGELAGIVGNVEVTDAYIGNGGFSGTVSDTWAPPLTAQLFGMPIKLQHVEITFVQNALTAAELSGQVILPFFDEPVDVEIGIALDGGFTVKLAQPGGLYTLDKPGVLSLELDSLTFERDDDKFAAILSGQVTPLFGGLDWPGFKVEQLAIDSEGRVRLAGGWLDLPAQYALDFHGFQFEITKLGFGKSEDGGKWIGFSGGLKLVDGLPAGASVEGLRVIWYDDGRPTRISLGGVGIEFEIPQVLRFKGAVSYRELDGDVHRFDGAIKLELLVLSLELDARLVVGSAPGYTFFAIYLGVELPAGIPLWATGLGLYGLAGLFAVQVEPDKHPDEEWYEGWYKRPAVGVTDLAQKWTNHADSFALGAGVTIGTVFDNGFTFAGKMLLVLIFPGPILMIEGKANLLKERAKLSDDPIFRALAVLDGRAGTFLVGLDAQYKYGSGGQLIDIHGSAEAFFDFTDASKWHLYLGEREPREKRIIAALFRLFEANSYFMLDPNHVAMGAWIGYDKNWHFGPLRITFEAWVEGNAVISWKPAYFHGDLWLHGKVELFIFGFGLGLSLDARFAADIFDPFHVLAELSVGINLPWPLPDFDVDFTLEWGPEKTPPPLPLPLKEIAVEHFKVTASWPLPRGQLLLPNYDSNGDGMIESPNPPVATQEAAPPPANAPVVPLDCRPHVTFGRTVHDDGPVAVNPQPVTPAYERIGDPAENQGPVKVRYGLKEVALHTYAGGSWQLVAQSPEVAGTPRLYGSWAPIPHMPDGGGTNVGQVKLWLWSKSPFDYTRHTGGAWDEWFSDHFSGYPCLPELPDREICCDFEQVDPNLRFPSPWQCPEAPIRLTWAAPTLQQVTVHQQVAGRTHALCFPGAIPGAATSNQVTIQIDEPSKLVRLIVFCLGGIQATGYDDNGNIYGPVIGGQPGNPFVEVAGQDLVRVVVQGYDEICIFGICILIGLSTEEQIIRQQLIQHTIDELAHWSQSDHVLKPHTSYRLKVVTTIQAQGEDVLDDYSQSLTQTEFAYFQTAGPPGLATLSIPDGHPNPDEFDSGLSDLSCYARQTIPMTVPGPGEKPLLPRPVYRAYDVGVEFNENYVDLMYRMEGRDLGLYLYDNSNQAVRDAQDRLIVLSNRWGQTETVTLNASEERWINVIDTSDCLSIDTSTIRQDTTLTSAGLVLDPDTLYEARLTPLLLHEAWSGYPAGASANGPSGTLGGWMVYDAGRSEGPSHWEVQSAGAPPSFAIVQTTNIWGGSQDGADPIKPGTMLLRADNPALPASHDAQPGNWSDYRLNVFMRSTTDDDVLGVVFRYRSTTDYYRFSIDRQRHYRRLVKVSGGVHTVLAEDSFSYQQNLDYLITVEAIGASIRLYQDGELIFDVTDSAIDRGRIGLYCWGNINTRFGDVWVDDFRPAAPVVYRFAFTTSLFTNFFHHMHSYQDETWRLALGEAPSDGDIAALVAHGVLPANPPGDTETRACGELTEQILGHAAWQRPAEVQVTRIERGPAALALLVQSPEPIDWRRSSLTIRRAAGAGVSPHIPADVKLTDITLGKTKPNQESVMLLLRKRVDLSGYRIEYSLIGAPGGEPAWKAYYTFSAEQPLPAGTRVQVYAGNQAGAGPSTPGVELRFIASGSASGQLLFPAAGVELRLVDPAGVAGHTRRFLPNSAYTAVDARVLRNADGTALFILMPSATPAGSAIPVGQYRLNLTYQRDNKAVDPASPVLSEAGNSAAEQVVLDIPW